MKYRLLSLGLALSLAIPAFDVSGQEKGSQKKSQSAEKKSSDSEKKKSNPSNKKKRGDARKGTAPNMLASMNGRFLRRDPRVGATLPDLSAFDEKGKPFSIKSTRGSYTVLVFGCLT